MSPSFLKPPIEARLRPRWGPRQVAVGIAVVLGTAVAAIGLLTVLYREGNAPFLAVLAGTFVLEVAMLGAAVRLGPRSAAAMGVLFGPRRFGTLTNFGWGGLAFLGSLAASAVYIAIASSFRNDLAPTPLPINIPDSGLRWLAFAIVVIVGPFAEEVFFRGFVFAGLLRRFNLPIAVLISAAVFAVAHVEVSVVGPAFLSGCVYALVYWRCGSLWPLVLAHTAQNAIAFGLAGTSISP